jgi:hypothetical protein
MTHQALLNQRLLRVHSIEHTYQDGEVYALDVCVGLDLKVYAVWLNVTTYTKSQLLAWLGY